METFKIKSQRMVILKTISILFFTFYAYNTKAQILKNFHFMDSETLWAINSKSFDTLSLPFYKKTRGDLWQMRENLYYRYDIFNQIISDKEGNLYGHTCNAIYKMNNGKWFIFNDTLQQFISDFKFDQNGNILIITTNGIYYKTKDNWRFYFASSVVDATFDNDSNIWYITKKKLVYLKNNASTEFYLENMQDQQVFKDVSFNGQQLYIAVNLNQGFGKNNIYNFQQGNWTKIIDNLSYFDKIIDNTGTIWFINDSIVKLKDNTISKVAIPDKYLTSRKIDQIKVQNDTIYTSYGFLTLITTKENTREYSSNTYPIREIYCSTISKDDTKWFGTEKGYIIKYHGNNFEYFNVPIDFQNSTVSKWIHSMAYSEKSKKLYLVTVLNNLFAYNGQSWEKFDSINGFSGDVQNIVYDQINECLWMSTNKGLCRINESNSFPSFEYYTQEHGLINNNIKLVYISTSGKLWCSTDLGISVFSFPEKTVVSYTDSISKSFIKWFAQDANGTMWASVEAFYNFHGLAKFDGSKWSIIHDWIPTRNGKTSSPDRFVFDKNNKIVATTGADNVAIYNPDSDWSIITPDDGLVPAYSREIIKSDSSFWITTGLGISEIQTNYYFNFEDSILLESQSDLSININIKTNCNWTVLDTSSWIETYKSEPGLTLACLNNPLAKMRSDKIQFNANGAGTYYLRVYQKAAATEIYAVPEQIYFLANDSKIVKVVINTNSDWEITSIPKWLHIDKLSGSLSSVISFSADKNNENTRDAYVTFNANGVTTQLKVVQEGVTFLSNEFNKRINIYPLPITDKLIVESGEIISKVSLRSVNGQLITTVKSLNTKAEVNTSQLKKGIYFIEIELENGNVLLNKISK